MHHRRFVPRSVWSALLLLVVMTGIARLGGAAERPNVLFIAIDDLRNWMGCMGDTQAQTPNLDRLAARGTLFTHAYCAAPWCNPSRTALLTGVRPSTSGVYTHYNVPWRNAELLKNAITLPQYFQQQGYTSLGAGKIFHHPDEAQDPQSWDDYWPSKTKCMLNTPLAKPPKNGLDLRSSIDWGPIDTPREEMPDWKVADWVAGQLAAPHDKPLFLACGFFRPHVAWYVPREYFDRYPIEKIKLPEIREDDLADVSDFARRMALGEGIPALNDPNDYGSCVNTFPILRDAGQWPAAVQAYLACVTFADECLGRVLDALDRSPYRDNTIVVLWSDHGWHHGEKLHWEKVGLWEEATHCVLMLSAPGSKPGQRCAAPVNLMDLYPTLVELCGLPPRTGLEGSSLVPLLHDPASGGERYSVTTHGKDNHTVRTSRWRYIRYATGDEELYDHDRDPHEWTNLASDPATADVRAKLRGLLPRINVEEMPPTAVELSRPEGTRRPLPPGTPTTRKRAAE